MPSGEVREGGPPLSRPVDSSRVVVLGFFPFNKADLVFFFLLLAMFLAMVVGPAVFGGGREAGSEALDLFLAGGAPFLQDEGAVSVLFGIGQRWMTTPPPPILRFNSGDPERVSSVMLPQNLQLNSSIPPVQTPVNSTEEPPGECQLVSSTLEARTLEALGDWRCSIFESELSSDKRWLVGSIFDLQRLRLESTYVKPAVLLGTYVFSCELCKRGWKSLSCTCFYV